MSTTTNITQNTARDWWMHTMSSLSAKYPAWSACFASMSMDGLMNIAEHMGSMQVLAPRAEDVFRPFSDLRPEQVKLVMIGMDPYPTPGMACGRAFAVGDPNAKMPVSLRNLMSILEAKTERNLDHWVSQGVFLINTSPVLTVPACIKIWTPFTQYVLGWLAVNNPNIIFVFMGRNAEQMLPQIHRLGAKCIVTPHPAERSGTFKHCQLKEQISQIGGNIDW